MQNKSLAIIVLSPMICWKLPVNGGLPFQKLNVRTCVWDLTIYKLYRITTVYENSQCLNGVHIYPEKDQQQYGIIASAENYNQ
jgi:hypothetical protein